jgi:hypothetical protein
MRWAPLNMHAGRRWIGAGTLSLLTVCSHARAQDVPDAAPTVVPVPSAPAEATAPPCQAERFVVLRSREGLAPALFNEVRTDLAAELAHRGILVCNEGASPREPAAIVVLSADDARVVIELDDRVTHKRVGRDLTLSSIPANGRALAIAIAIDELLRASWAELTLRRTREDEEDDEPQRIGRSTRTVNARGSVEQPLHVALGGEVGFAHTPQRYDAFSLSARASIRPWERGWFALSVGGLSSLPVSSSLGDVLASGLRVALTGGVCGRDRHKAFGCAGLRSEFDYLSLRGFSPKMARGGNELAPVVHVAAVGALGVTLQSGRTLMAELSAGGVLQGAEATDGSDVVMGVTGLMLGLHVGLDFEL